MKLIARGLILSSALAILVPCAALAATDYVSNAADGLAHSSVYVAPGTGGTNADTAGKLAARLTTSDNIVLVMLPASAEADSGLDIATIASKLSDKLGNGKIIGIAVGNKVVGFAPSLPTGVAADQMQRASSVSNDPFTALGTFVQNIHSWQTAHPAPTPAPSGSDSGGGIPWFLVIVVIACLLVAAAAFVAFVGGSHSESASGQPHFDAPGPVRNLLVQIAGKRDQIDDPALSRLVYQICLDIEHYFKTSTVNRKSDSATFAKSLTEIDDIVTKYIEVQDNARYYTNPSQWLAKERGSLEDFSAFVLKSIQDGNDVALGSYSPDSHALPDRRDA